MKLVLLFGLLCYVCKTESLDLRKFEQTSFESHKQFRFKRQAPAGECFRNETYNCTTTTTEQFRGVCPLFGIYYFCTRTRQRQVASTCLREVRECCEGYEDEDGVCVLASRSNTMLRCTAQPIFISNPSGEILSPNHPSTYPSNSNCTWILAAPLNVEIRVQITSIQLQNARQTCDFRGCFFVCQSDRLVLSDEERSWTLCGSQGGLPSFTSSRGFIRIQFFSNAAENFAGFRITYEIDLPQPSPSPTLSIVSQTTTPTTVTTLPPTPRTLLVSTSQTTTTRSSFLCLGDQTFENCAPFCWYRCENGTAVGVTCHTQFEGFCRQACVCPADRPVLYKSSCLTVAQCAATYRPPPVCHGGMVPVSCLPTCTPSCERQTLEAGECPYPAPDQCVSGCMCPPNIPINRDGTCIPRQLCPPPTPPTITCGTQFYQPNVRITGGETAVRGSWPWMTQIIKVFPTEKFQCGGTVICENWVLTAAHCFQNSQNIFVFDTIPALYRIRIGKHNRTEEVGTHFVIQIPQRIILHPQYDSQRTVNDVALVQLRQPLVFSRNIRPACMPAYEQPSRLSTRWGPSVGARCYAIGWGDTLNQGPSNRYLKQAKLPIRSTGTCIRLYQHFNQSISYCVGGRSRDDTCTGDSGGPLLCRHGSDWYVDGITSYGLECGRVGFPGVYTRMSAYSNWVRQMTGSTCGHPDTQLTHNDT